ncbi:conserved hypothetical protein [Carnobacterium sp. 17-4]|uniref:hypothetical protein n=1 Tax=Carnobacterium sp. (strain 17-4) TaxID=208596 RepID=UPI0002059260|nr:hypothetical protein [Carnobacterium sp. 17-4]AEB30383.1 conserved hypothetical protein [Carnobacterium sp. 17-4]
MNTKDVKIKRNSLSWLLAKNRLIEQLGLNVFRYEKDRRKRNSKIAVTIAIGMVLLMIITYCGGMAYGYVYLGLTELIPSIAIFISSLFIVIFSLFKSNGEFFGFSDYDLVMSLPITVRTIISSRFLNMYIWNTFIAFLVMFPMGLIYMLFEQPNFMTYLIWFISIFLVSLIPTTIAAIFGAVVTAIASKFRYTSAVVTILSIGLVVVFMSFMMTASTADFGFGELFDFQTGTINADAFSTLAPFISDRLNQLYLPTKLFKEAVVDGKLLSFLIFVVVSIGLYFLFLQLLSLKYKQINTALTSHSSKGNYKIGVLRQSGVLLALYKKTLMRILKSTVAATNLLIGCVLAILLAISTLTIGPEKILQSLELAEYFPILKNVAGYVIAAMVSMTNTATISLALEGRNVWLIKSLPISPKTLYDSYLLTNLTFTIPTSIVCSLLFSISLKTSFIETILIIVTPLSFLLFTAVGGIFIGNRMAYYDWQDETQLVKQSMMSLIGMLGGIIIIVFFGIIANIGILPLEIKTITFSINLFILIFTVLLYLHECNRPIKQ